MAGGGLLAWTCGLCVALKDTQARATCRSHHLPVHQIDGWYRKLMPMPSPGAITITKHQLWMIVPRTS
eukprot:scaffold26631_cov139-Skeletonema_menzelii.AAC.12